VAGGRFDSSSVVGVVVGSVVNAVAVAVVGGVVVAIVGADTSISIIDASSDVLPTA